MQHHHSCSPATNGRNYLFANSINLALGICLGILALPNLAEARGGRHHVLRGAAPAVVPAPVVAPAPAAPAPVRVAPAPVPPVAGEFSRLDFGELKFIEPCCFGTPTGPSSFNSSYSIKKDTDGKDPYTTGPLDLPRRALSVRSGIHYVYVPPSELGSPTQIPRRLGYQIPPQKTGESQYEYDLRRLSDILRPAGIRVQDISTFIGSGSQSNVYMIHPPAPSLAELRILYPDDGALRTSSASPMDTRRILWAKDHSTEVLKLRTPSPWGLDMNEAVREARRDLTIYDVFRSASDRFRIRENGRFVPLIEPVPYNNMNMEVQKGVFRQPAIKGDTAYKIAAQISQARAGDPVALNYLTTVLRFKSLEDAELKLRLLETFYSETHYDVIRFEDTNGLPKIAGYVRNPEVTDPDALIVGFDYNLGRNVIWDASAQVFKAIDF